MSTPPAGKPDSTATSKSLPIPEHEEDKEELSGKYLSQQVTTPDSETSPNSSNSVVMRKKGTGRKSVRHGFRTPEELFELTGEYGSSGGTLSSARTRAHTTVSSSERRKVLTRQYRSSLTLDDAFTFSYEDLQKIQRSLSKKFSITRTTSTPASSL